VTQRDHEAVTAVAHAIREIDGGYDDDWGDCARVAVDALRSWDAEHAEVVRWCENHSAGVRSLRRPDWCWVRLNRLVSGPCRIVERRLLLAMDEENDRG